MVPVYPIRADVLTRAATANNPSWYKVRQYLYKLEFRWDQDRWSWPVNSHESLVHHLNSWYARIHGTRAIRGALWRQSRHLCLWHVYVGDDHIVATIQRVFERSIDLQKGHIRWAAYGPLQSQGSRRLWIYLQMSTLWQKHETYGAQTLRVRIYLSDRWWKKQRVGAGWSANKKSISGKT